MNKKIGALIAVAVAAIIAVLIVAFVGRDEKADMDKLADRIDNAVMSVMGEDVKKVSMTELVATLTYSNGNAQSNIDYHILKTTYYEGGDPDAVTGLNTDALGLLFIPDEVERCEEMMIRDWPGALYQNDGKAYLCWTYDAQVTYVLEYDPAYFAAEDMVRMAESVGPIEG